MQWNKMTVAQKKHKYKKDRARERANPERTKTNNRKATLRPYGLTEQAYENMVVAQDGNCAICKAPRPDSKKLVVDHNHVLGKVRGLLCSNCNCALGQVHESLETIQRLYDYVEAHKEG